jgi:hypothetical protein
MSDLTFIHKFSRTVACTVRVGDQAPEAGSTLDLRFEWNGKPKPKHIPEYRRWMLSVIQTQSDHWQSKIMYALQSSPHQTEMWVFEPGEPPKRFTADS